MECLNIVLGGGEAREVCNYSMEVFMKEETYKILRDSSVGGHKDNQIM